MLRIVMNLINDGVIRDDDKSSYLLVILKGAFDLAGIIRGKRERLEDLASVLMVLQKDVFLDHHRMVSGQKSAMSVCRNSMKQLNKAFTAIEQAGVDAVEWEEIAIDEHTKSKEEQCNSV
jgi:hypothetical protein